MEQTEMLACDKGLYSIRFGLGIDRKNSIRFGLGIDRKNSYRSGLGYDRKITLR